MRSPSHVSQRTTLRKNSKLWYTTQGAIVIIAGNYAFRVPEEQLRQRAVLFPLREGRNTDYYEGCRSITLPDSSFDMQAFLLALFNAKFVSGLPKFSFSDPDTYRVYAGILKLSRKYGAPYWRRKALHLLSPMFPSTLDHYDRLCAPIPQKALDMRAARTASREVVDAATIANAKWLLPAATLYLISSAVSNVSGGPYRLHPNEGPLSKIYTQYWERHVARIVAPLSTAPACTNVDGCSATLTAFDEEIMTRHKYELRIVLGKHSAVRERLCGNCALSYEARYQQLRRKFWAAVPSMFGQESWQACIRDMRKDLEENPAFDPVYDREFRTSLVTSLG
ncbi:hypothetical protein HDZ31DRAFT_44438 [Schizophyllum fasciatum]